jgi:superfamily I DNA/RNA helicase
MSENFKPSKYQKDIFNFIKNGKGNAIINAVAGSGKTTTLLKSLEIIPKDKTVFFVAYNKSIADELEKKIPKDNPNITVKTVHRLGYSVLKNLYSTEFDKYKYNKMFQNLSEYNKTKQKKYISQYNLTKKQITKISEIFSKIETDNFKKFIRDIINLTNLGRLYLINHVVELDGINDLKNVIKKHDIDVTNEQIYIAWQLINFGIQSPQTCDFTDMIFLPIILNLEMEKYDFLYVDEIQDISTCQRLLILNSLKPKTGRLIGVGDKAQSIYGFSGADATSFDKMCKIENTILLPLSISYRCSTEIVNYVKSLNPIIEANPKNTGGQIIDNSSYKDVEDGDFVLCRQTFPLVSLCMKYLLQGKMAFILGSDIGLTLVGMIEDVLKKDKLVNMITLFSHFYNDKKKIIEKIMENEKIPFELASESQTVITFVEKIEMIEALSININTPHELINKINSIFNDNKKNGICLSTIHKSKGLEANRVFILHPELMPSKYAKLDWELQQEKNLKYVAYTRAKKTLAFIRDFDAWGSHSSQEKNVKQISESKHIGVIGSRYKINGTVSKIRKINGKFGETTAYDIVDEQGNLYSKLGVINDNFIVDESSTINENTKLSFYGIIKNHSEFNGTKINNIGKIMEY